MKFGLFGIGSGPCADPEVALSVAQAGEAFPVWRYTDVGCLVYYLKCISWEIPDFSVDRYRNVLLSLHKRMRTDGTPFEARLHLFYLGLQKPGGGGEPIL